MARIRTIKPEFPQSESMGQCSRDARLCFIMLWTIADDEGRLRGASRMLASLLFPYDNDAPKLIDRWLAELVERGCIIRYSVDGQSYIQIANWLDHQKIDRPSQSKFPPFDGDSRTLANIREDSSLDQRTKDQGPKDHGSEEPPRNARRKPRCGIDPDWKPTSEDREFAQGLGCSADEITPEFVDWNLANGILSTNWSLNFRNRCRQLARRRDERPSGGGRMAHRQSPNSLIAAARAVAAQIEGEP